jgi:hypothetical protein
VPIRAQRVGDDVALDRLHVACDIVNVEEQSRSDTRERGLARFCQPVKQGM